MLQRLVDRYLNDTHRAYRERAKCFARERITPHVEAIATLFDVGLYKAAAIAGLLGPTQPAVATTSTASVAKGL